MMWLLSTFIFICGVIAGWGVGRAAGQASVWRFISQREREAFVKDDPRDN